MLRYYVWLAITLLVAIAGFLVLQYRSYTNSYSAFERLFHQTIETQAKIIVDQTQEYPQWHEGEADTNVDAQLLRAELAHLLAQGTVHSLCLIDENNRVLLDPRGIYGAGEIYPLDLYRPFPVASKSGVAISQVVAIESEYFVAALFALDLGKQCVIEASAATANTLSQIRTRFLVFTITGSLLLLAVGTVVILVFYRLTVAEKDLIEKERLATIGQMSATIAHEIKNPLGIIRSSAQLLQESPELPEEDGRAIGYIVDEVDRLDRRVRSFLQLARDQKPALLRMDLAQCLKDLLHSYLPALKEKQVNLEWQIPDDPALILGDRDQLIQVFHNLIQNAAEALEVRGDIRVQLTLDQGKCKVIFHDSGPGIGPHQQDEIFRPFFSMKARGTGLGLAVSRRIARAHGGDLHLEPGPAGCTFVLTLPVQGETNG